MSKSGNMKFVLISPEDSEGPVNCSYVKFVISDGAKGSEGGSYEVKSGHTDAVFALDEGEVAAGIGGGEELRRRISGGFASVRDNVVKIAAESVL